MSRKFDSALDDCLSLLRAGASIRDCLARYPEYAEELAPLLSLASGVRAVPTPRPDPVAVNANRQRMLDAAQETAARRQKHKLAPFAWTGKSGGSRVRPLMRASMTLIAVIVLVSLAAGALFASAADSLPGQALYPVKLLCEDARLSLTLSTARRQELQSEYMLERRREVRQILDAGQQAIFEFRGELEEIGDEYWIIGGLKVILNSDTLVEGQTADGAMVIVHASASGDGSLRALKLQVLTNPLLLTPTITSTPTPRSTPTPEPTATVTAVPSVTPTPTPTVSSTPSTTPMPTATMTSTPSPFPTETSIEAPSATSTPTHSEEPDDTDTPQEHDTEESEHTDEPESAEEP